MTRRAVVAGAGIAGLAVATGLAHDGWQVTVRERWEQIPLVGTGIGLWPAAQQGLAALSPDLRDVIEREAVEFGDAAIFRPDGRRLTKLPRDAVERRSGVPVRILPRSALLAALLDSARAAGAAIETGVTVDPAHTDADLVVAADGLRSALREAAFPGATGARYAGGIAMRGESPGEHGPNGETWGPGQLYVGVTRTRPGHTNWYAMMPGPADRRPDLDELLAATADWHDPIPLVLRTTTPGSLLRHPIHDLHPALPSFVSGRLAVVGDAAHAMTPNLGRGACEAVLDAVALTRALRGATVADGLAAYDAERRRPAQRIAARSWQAGRLARGGWFSPLRDGLVRAASPLVR